MIAVASGSAVSIWTLRFSATDKERVSAQRVARLTSPNEEVNLYNYVFRKFKGLNSSSNILPEVQYT
jgi:hypothetical protein